jgi:hypothetical protein
MSNSVDEFGSVHATIQMLSIACACGKTHRFELGHYGLGRGPCGRNFWALQPRRGGALKLFPWPGPNLTRQQLKERERAAKGTNDETH